MAKEMFLILFGVGVIFLVSILTGEIMFPEVMDLSNTNQECLGTRHLIIPQLVYLS